VRARLDVNNGPAWIAVIYADWQSALAPDPESILEQATGTDRIVGVLVDTWDKTRPIELDERWVSRSARLRQAGGAGRRARLPIDRVSPLDCSGHRRRSGRGMRRWQSPVGHRPWPGRRAEPIGKNLSSMIRSIVLVQPWIGGR